MNERFTPHRTLDYIKTDEDLDNYARAFLEAAMRDGLIWWTCPKCKERNQTPLHASAFTGRPEFRCGTCNDKPHPDQVLAQQNFGVKF